MLDAIKTVLASYRSTEAHITEDEITAAWAEHAAAGDEIARLRNALAQMTTADSVRSVRLMPDRITLYSCEECDASAELHPDAIQHYFGPHKANVPPLIRGTAYVPETNASEASESCPTCGVATPPPWEGEVDEKEVHRAPSFDTSEAHSFSGFPKPAALGDFPPREAGLAASGQVKPTPLTQLPATTYDWENHPDFIRATRGRSAVVDAMLLCPCRVAEARGESLGPCACSGPPSTVERVVRASDVDLLLAIATGRKDQA